MTPKVVIIIENGEVTEITANTKVSVYVVDLSKNKESIIEVQENKKFVDELFQ